MDNIRYFISFALKPRDLMFEHVTKYGNAVLDLPHEFQDFSDISDLQVFLEKEYDSYTCVILNIIKMPI